MPFVKSILLTKYPNRTVVYDESAKLDLNNAPLNGGVLVKTLQGSLSTHICAIG